MKVRQKFCTLALASLVAAGTLFGAAPAGAAPLTTSVGAATSVAPTAHGAVKGVTAARVKTRASCSSLGIGGNRSQYIEGTCRPANPRPGARLKLSVSCASSHLADHVTVTRYVTLHRGASFRITAACGSWRAVAVSYSRTWVG